MRTLAVVLIALTMSGCCCGSCGRKPENFVVDAPATTEEAKKRARPPDVTVDVERITRNSAGGPCHSAVCLIILPVLLFNAVFPEKYDLVTVKDHGVETFSGTFSTNGTLMTGVVHLEGGEQKQVLAMTLTALDKSMIVESARLKPGGSDGGMTRVVTSLQSQHDFLVDYRKALEAEKTDTRRGALLSEALQWLDAEALPMVTERLKDPDEPDLAKAAVVRALCEVHPSPHESAVLTALGEAAGPYTSLAELPCADDDTVKRALLSRAVTGTCAELKSQKIYELNKAAMEAISDKPQLKAAVSEAAKGCPPPVAALFGLQLGEEVDRAGLSAVLQGSQSTTAIPLLSLSNPLHRAAYFDALGSGQQTEELLPRLHDLTLTPDELTQLTKAYLVDRIFFSRNSTRALVLSSMKHNCAGVDTAPARKLVTIARDHEKEGDRPIYELALLVLGDHTRAAAASKGARSPRTRALSTEGDLVNFGLILSGCTDVELDGWLASGGKRPLSCSAWSKK